MVHLRERLAKFVRTQRGDTPQRRFARRIGVAQSTIMRIENQEQNVTLDTLEQLCKAFHVDVAGLFAETSEKQPAAQYVSRANMPAGGMEQAAVHEPTTPDKVGRGKMGRKKAGKKS
jgi:transcriptional regulator with XRE-family HTH domain